MNSFELYLAGKPVGNYREMCPKCNGGTTKEKSLAITVEDQEILWFCHRASCTFKGRIKNYSESRGEVFEKPIVFRPLPVDKPNYFRLTVYDNEQENRGYVYRIKEQYRGSGLPKNINEYDSDWCGLHFPKHIGGSRAILVEDHKSATMMAADGFPAVALLGTHLNEAKIDYLINQGIIWLTLALDPDATGKSIQLSRQWTLIDQIIALDKDYKDMSHEERAEFSKKYGEVG